MSIVYKSKRYPREFDANVAGCQAIGKAHKLLGLPVDHEAERASGGRVLRVPYTATAKDCRTWALAIWDALKTFAGVKTVGDTWERNCRNETSYLIKWAEFLSTCSGYRSL